MSNIVLMPRIGPKPIVAAGLLLAAAGMAWLTQITPHSSYAANILGPIIVTGLGMGLMFSHGVQHRHLRGAPAGRGRRLGVGQHRPAARRRDGHRAA